MAQPSSILTQIHERLRHRGSRMARQVLGDATYPRRWIIPPLNGWDGDPSNIADMGLAFDRTDLNADAEAQYAGGGNAGAVMAYSLQIQQLSMLERSYRARHRSLVRSITHAASRRTAHGHAENFLTGDTLNYIQDLLDAGGTP